MPAAGTTPWPNWSPSKAECEAWLNALPEALQDTATAEALRAICDFDLTDVQSIEPPRGFGRD